METIWLSPTNYVTGDPTLRVSYPFVSHPSTIVACTTPGDLKWVSLGLRLPPEAQIEEVIICYEVSNVRSFISQVRLAEMTTPDHAIVVHDDPTHLTSTAPATYSSAVSGLVPSGALTLELRLNFQDASDEIQLGAVGVKIQAPTGRCVSSIADLKALSAGAFRCVQLLGYYAPGDGGGGGFYWDASSTQPDNGGTIIIPASNPATGRWKRLVEGGYVDVRRFGARGDALANDTAAIQDAVDFAATRSGIICVSEGIYMIDALTSINLRSNSLFWMSPRATLRAIPNSATNYSILKIYDVENVTVVGGTVQGERMNHIVSAPPGEWGMGVDIRNGTNITIRDVTAKDCWGDGFYIDKGAAAGSESRNVKLQNCIADNNRRQGCSIVGLIGGILDGCVFSNTGGPNGTPPQAGVDIEPDQDHSTREIAIVNCTFSKNAGAGILTYTPDLQTNVVDFVLVSGNLCRENSVGILLSGGTDINVVNNFCISNQQANIGVGLLTNGQLVNCSIQCNVCRAAPALTGYGLFIGGPPATVSGTFVCNNDLLASAAESKNNFVDNGVNTVNVNNRS